MGTEAPTICSPFGSEPNHIANRLFRSLFIRVATDGREFGCDENDPLLWGGTRHLLASPSHERALEALDRFLSTQGERKVTDARQRAFLHRSLWALFDWSASLHDTAARRQALQVRLAPILRRLRLGPHAIRSLPDNYAEAVAAGSFQAEYDPDRPEQPFLPRDLFDAKGPWVCLKVNAEPTAPTHLWTFSGRSVFLVFIRLPEGRRATLDYLERQREDRGAQFPPGTAFALVRQALVIDSEGSLAATSVTEKVQIRVYRSVTSRLFGGRTPEIGERGRLAQAVFEFKLSWRELLAGKSGLRAVRPEEKEFALFASHGWDLFEKFPVPPFDSHLRTTLRSCASCHSAPGIESVLTRGYSNRGARTLLPTELQWEREATIHWKQQRYDWGLLEGLLR